MKPTVAAIIAIAVGVAGFFGGMMYQKSKAPSFGQGNFAQFNRNGNNGARRNGFAGGGMTVGQVISADKSTLTVKMADGSSKIVILTDTTRYSNTSQAAATDVKVGTNVGVFGTPNSDGSVTATNVQLNPEFRNFPTPTQAK